jgi:hypothetical protein
MSIISDKIDPKNNRYIKDSAQVLKPNNKKDVVSMYAPTDAEKVVITSILKDFRNGWQTMHLPRPEFNDLSLYQRHIVDMLAFNTYQENDGNPMMEDRLGGWKSNAIRPIIRNKAISIAAHETARLIVPKVFAYNDDDDEQEDSAKVMGYLVDWAREQANYPHMALFRVFASLYSPISWGYSEYVESYRKVWEDGKIKEVLDEDESGFQHLPISTDQVYFSNFYERECQKQDFIIKRIIMSYDRFVAKYPKSEYPNAKFVKPGIVVVMDDANRGFYQVYDPHMRGDDVEEVIRWRKNAQNEIEIDSRAVMVNGILLENKPNPRQDHQFPFDAFYYLPINERCIAGKSLVFALQSDATIVNTLYQIYIDGEVLKRFPPVITTGSDKVGVDVFTPGLNLSFADENVKINPINNIVGDSQSLIGALEKVEASVSESSQGTVQQGQETPGTPSTAYEISRIEQNAATVLGLSMKFIAQHAINYGKLLMSDVLQYMTIADTAKITGDSGLVYKTFYAKEPGHSGKQNKISFDANMPDTMTEEEKMDMSFKLLQAQGGLKSATTLWKVNPVLFRDYKYSFTVDSDVLNPRSAELARAFSIELFDRAIAHPETFDSKSIGKLLLSTDPTTKRDPDNYLAKAQALMTPTPGMGGTDTTPGMGSAAKPNAPTQGNQLPQSMGK